MEWRQVKIGLFGFLLMLVASMLTLKPYLFTAIYHNYAALYDYRFFTNREVPVKAPGLAWPISSMALADPDVATLKLLADTQTTALLVLEDGKIVYEKYFLSGGKDVLSGSFSMAKSVLALLYGVALREGRIKSLDEPLSRYVLEWEDRDEGKITLKQLLQMASGLNWNESSSNLFSISTEGYYGRDLHLTALRQHRKEEPGLHFSYQSGSSQLLALALTRAVNQTLSEYFSRKLWIPLGAEKTALWSLDHEDGMEKGFCCINATARDFARIGELVRLQGRWQGQELVSANYLNEMLTPSELPNEKGETNRNYGYQWWSLSTPGGDVPYAAGLMGQYIVVVPQKNRVLVRLGMKTLKAKQGPSQELRALVNWMLK